ncbi:MAG TPA: amidohydrolase [Casimicrobiaceae bacterium]|nr:amidohydrolase [Casimicrobiaceae bacterium]
MNRRSFLRLAAPAALAGVPGCDFSVREGLFNACRAALPPLLQSHPLVNDAWNGIDPTRVVDFHCHLFGNGDSGEGVWVNPSTAGVIAPAQWMQRMFYLNAGCVHDHPGRVDASVVDRLRNQAQALPQGVRLLLLAFDWARDERGMPQKDRSTFYVGDEYAARIASSYPRSFEWAASIHPYDPSALDRLDRAIAARARAVKWLPTAQNIDPASKRCVAFYRRLAALGVPLITHGGEERAVTAHDASFGNPLKLRVALDEGVRVIVAHCASLGVAHDTDRGGVATSAFALFARLMDEARYAGRLFGDLSAVTFGNRSDDVLATLLVRSDWHGRLINGSDYPLPGVLPLVALDRFVARGMLAADAVPVLREIRDHHAILFDFVLKRALRAPHRTPAQRLPATVFETRRHLAGSG